VQSPGRKRAVTRQLRLGIVAGEPSGDMLGARVLRELAARCDGLAVEGIGGERMADCGLRSLVPMERLSVMGFSEPLRRLPELLRLRRRLAACFLRRPPDLFLGIDSPAFNLPLARRMHRAGIPTAHMVSPAVWAWRPGRVHRIGQSVDLVLCLFPFEPPLYTAHGIRAQFVGHPLAHETADCPDQGGARAALGLPGEVCVLARLPGSRASEVRQLAPIFLEAAQRLAADRPQLRLVMPVANDACRRVLEPLLTEYDALPLTLLYNDARTALSAADAALVASGTATLETALLQRPMVVAYRMRALSALLVSRLLRTEYVALPNILAGRQLVPELLQGAATPEAVLAAVEPLLDNPRKSAEMVAGFRAMRTSLAVDFAAESAGALMNLVLSRRGCPDRSVFGQL